MKSSKRLPCKSKSQSKKASNKKLPRLKIRREIRRREGKEGRLIKAPRRKLSKCFD